MVDKTKPKAAEPAEEAASEAPTYESVKYAIDWFHSTTNRHDLTDILRKALEHGVQVPASTTE
jgi:hypothetical protein